MSFVFCWGIRVLCMIVAKDKLNNAVLFSKRSKSSDKSNNAVLLQRKSKRYKYQISGFMMKTSLKIFSTWTLFKCTTRPEGLFYFSVVFESFLNICWRQKIYCVFPHFSPAPGYVTMSLYGTVVSDKKRWSMPIGSGTQMHPDAW